MKEGKIFTATDPRGIIVSCNAGIWHGHILSGHSIMTGNENAVKVTVEDPDAIYPSDEYEDRDVYFRGDSGATYNAQLFTKVIVERAGNEGEIITAFPSRSISGGIKNDDGPIFIRRKLR